MNKIIGLIALLITASATAEGVDNRTIIELNDAQRDHVLSEMRSLLAGTQSILTALAQNDMEAVSQSARQLGMNMAHKAENHLGGVLPQEFMQLGMSLHQDFDKIAANAGIHKDSRQLLQQLSESMNKCVACHATYQIHPTQ